MPADYIIGADISWVQQREDRGVKYSDNGVEKDILQILKDHGFNYIRLCVFNDPTKATPRDRPYSPQGYCDLPQTIMMGKHVKAAGLKLLIDFHYSDAWADPGKQFTPSAWAELSFDDLVKKMHDWTRDSVQQMKDAGAMHDIVQVGNEIKRGKHVYCEKPLTHSVWESHQLAAAARAAKVATQMGNPGQASPETQRLCELDWAGAIGNVLEVHIWTDRPSQGLFKEYRPQGVARSKDSPSVPDTLDWDLWLGPAPARPYHPAYLPFKWRGWWDFGTGALGDIGCHSCDPVFRAFKLGAPISVQGASTRVNEDTYPVGSMVTYEFPARDASVQANNRHVTGLTGIAAGAVAMPPCKLVWYDGGLRPARPAGLPDGKLLGDNGRLLIGEKGFILGNAVYPESRAKDIGEIAPTLPRSPGHYVEWIEACKGGKAGGVNFDWAGPLAEAVLLGNVTLRLQLREDLTRFKLLWDSANLKFTNLADADTFIRREYRAGWSL